jgi:hypothetical protein
MVLPLWVRLLVWRLGLVRSAFSKYSMGIDGQRLERKFFRGVGHTVEFPGEHN